jgi:hypothetical protein
MKISDLAIIISAIGVIAAIIFQTIQTIRSIQTQKMQREMIRAQVLMNFSTRFYEIVKNGSLRLKIEDEQWAYQYWSLLSTEFYFFHHKIIPSDIYALWMTDLAKLYVQSEKTRQMHEEYLGTYSYNYANMVIFFKEINDIAKTDGEENSQHSKIFEFVKGWQNKNKSSILSR